MLTSEPVFERRRVASHIARAEAQARTRPPRLDPIRQLVRGLFLDEVARYRRGGRFPRNPGLPGLVPVFVDAGGTRCAVAHLLEVSGEGDLVRKIARERNRARVRELADEPRLRAWLEAAGLTLAEAAAIQPAYCRVRSSCVCVDRPEHPVPAGGV